MHGLWQKKTQHLSHKSYKTTSERERRKGEERNKTHLVRVVYVFQYFFMIFDDFQWFVMIFNDFPTAEGQRGASGAKKYENVYFSLGLKQSSRKHVQIPYV